MLAETTNQMEGSKKFDTAPGPVCLTRPGPMHPRNAAVSGSSELPVSSILPIKDTLSEIAPPSFKFTTAAAPSRPVDFFFFELWD
jgi:hypothetical protein